MLRSTIRLIIEKLTMYHEKRITDAIVDGVTVLDVSDTTVLLINTGISDPLLNTAGLSEPETENNTAGVVRPCLLYIQVDGASGLELDDTVSGSATIELNGNSKLQLNEKQNAQFLYNPEDAEWTLVSTTGTLVP